VVEFGTANLGVKYKLIAFHLVAYCETSMVDHFLKSMPDSVYTKLLYRVVFLAPYSGHWCIAFPTEQTSDYSSFRFALLSHSTLNERTMGSTFRPSACFVSGSA
jgi:hypothetical protein